MQVHLYKLAEVFANISSTKGTVHGLDFLRALLNRSRGRSNFLRIDNQMQPRN
jgi:hypothetical protein